MIPSTGWDRSEIWYATGKDGFVWEEQGVVVPNGPEGAWDQFSIHDQCPPSYKGRIYLYYKSEANGKPEPIRFQGVAMADDPLEPFEKCPLNPVLNSGHETGLLSFKSRIAALAIRHGNEHNTIQFARDGINFEVVFSVSLMPLRTLAMGAGSHGSSAT